MTYLLQVAIPSYAIISLLTPWSRDWGNIQWAEFISALSVLGLNWDWNREREEKFTVGLMSSV